jgi:ferredoxin-type protein NapG
MGKSGKDVSRRELLTFWRRPQPVPAAGPPPPLRPPGALDEKALLDTCHRCGKCVEACPADAIFPLGAAWGAAQGTPAIDARRRPCVICTGLECTHVCPSGALKPLAAAAQIAMGTAVVDERRCVTYRGEACDVCRKSCPIPGALVVAGGVLRVEARACVGCGLCEHVCPTEPAAIRVAPRA